MSKPDVNSHYGKPLDLAVTGCLGAHVSDIQLIR
jgi:hypothetical protein